jgi:hypothetical protein
MIQRTKAGTRWILLINYKEIVMEWIRNRLKEPSTLAAAGVITMVLMPLVPPQYQLLVQGIAAALGIGGVVRPENAK